jgi:hypothetical protein
MELKLGENQYTTIHLEGLDRLREEGSFASPPRWVCSDTTIVKITPSEDGRECRIEAARPVLRGSAIVTVTDRDDSSLSAVIFNITVTNEQITALGATIDPATEIGKQPPERALGSAPPASEKRDPQPPLPKGAVQRDPDTGVFNKSPGDPFGTPEQPAP